MEIHPAAQIFPPMDQVAYKDFCEDLKRNGLLEDIVTLDGKILDGRNRYRACEELRIPPRTREYSGDDPVAFVLSVNLHRRHLTPAQRAMVGARAREWYDRQAKERQTAAGERGKEGGRGHKKTLPANLPEGNSGDARDQVAKVVGVSGRSVDYASKVLKEAIPEVVVAVEEGRMAVSTAAILSSEPEDVQRNEATRPKRNRDYRSVSNGFTPEVREPEPQPEPGKQRGVGVIIANEAINCLIRIPKNDGLRKRGFQIVTDWIRANR